MGSGTSTKQRLATSRLCMTALQKSGLEAYEEITRTPGWKEARIGRRQWTTLHFAVWKGDSQLVSLLVAAGCSAHATDSAGDSPLSLARELEDFQLRMLLESHEKQTSSTLEVEGQQRLKEAVDSSVASAQGFALSSETALVHDSSKVRPG